MKSSDPNVSNRQGTSSPSRYEILLQQEVLACEDPVCCCEPEPRWLMMQHDQEHPESPSEWESVERAPKDEL